MLIELGLNALHCLPNGLDALWWAVSKERSKIFKRLNLL